jgi:hypothetical protein
VLVLVAVSGAGVIGRRAVDLGRVGESAGVGVGIGFWCWDLVGVFLLERSFKLARVRVTICLHVGTFFAFSPDFNLLFSFSLFRCLATSLRTTMLHMGVPFSYRDTGWSN